MTNVDRSTVPGRVADARRGGTVTFVSGGAAERVEWARLHEDARAVAAALQARGVGPGAHVALLALTSRALVTAIQATWLAGATAVVLPLPMRMGSLGEFVAQTRARIAGADAALVAIGDELAAMLDRQEGDPPVVVLGQLLAEAAALGAGRFDPPAIDPESLAVLQFTSGSTAEPKGVMLPHRTILANLDGATEAAALDPESDVLVSWLPLYHDMGLIGLLTLAMITGTDLVLGAPHDYLSSPGSWMEWISRFGGTATAGPNFAYALATRALRRQGGLDLSRLRVALSGAEPVDPRTFAAFCEAAGAHGFDPRAAFPAFGMAEVAIAGTFPPLLSGLRTDTIEIDGQGRTFALLGRPIPGLEMRVVDPSTGAARGAREVGELEFAGTSVTSGYYRRPDAT
ncbi:MAG: AMP-binding protein, partial [Acidimicrobiales bacterium]